MKASLVRHALTLALVLVASLAFVLTVPPLEWRLPIGVLMFVGVTVFSSRRLMRTLALDGASPPVASPQTSAVQAEMASELLATLLTLERTYEPLRGAAHSEVVQRRIREPACLPDLRTVLMRLRLLVPSLSAGRPVLPDMALQRQQTLAAREQSERERAELGQAQAAQRHVASLQRTVVAVLAVPSKTLTGSDASALQTLLTRLEHAHHAVQVLQLTLEAEA